MTDRQPLQPDALCLSRHANRFSFASTDELDDLTQDIGQDRATEAIRFGIGMPGKGYNIYVLGPSGLGKHDTVRRLLEKQAQQNEVALYDWCYLNNFKQSSKPRLLQIPAGRGAILQADMQQLVQELEIAIPAAFEHDAYLTSLRQIEEGFEQKEQEALKRLRKEAKQKDIKLEHRPGTFTFVPQHEGHAVAVEDYEKQSKKERERIDKAIAELQQQLEEILEKRIPQWHREARARVKELNRKTTMMAVGHIINMVKEVYQDLPAVLGYLDQVQDDVIENVDAFRKQGESGEEAQLLRATGKLTLRYRINLLVDNGQHKAAPVIYEDNPAFSALIGRIEHTAQLGTLVTDFTQIKAGALQQANGGYLILDAHKVLTQPYAWQGLKRVLMSGEIRIESLAQVLSLISTSSLEPEAIPLNIKVVLLGDRLLYYLLYTFDSDFSELFKVAADFDSSLPRSEQSELMYARLIATLARKHKLRPFDRDAVTALIRFSMRHVEDIHKLSTHIRSLTDLMQEASYWAAQAAHETVTDRDIDKARDAQIARHSRSRDRWQENILRGSVMIDTEGSEVGQINGLSVVDLGNFSYGVPSRITATTRLGEGEMLDIEREAELGGPIHSKGVFILSSYLGAQYSGNTPLSLHASLTFEQSYGDIEGDSASLAELCALLSSLADVPLKQSLAVTGSVNQLGKVQAIGGVNDKIEGFFDICKQRGLNNTQGVIIPTANIENLMLRDDIIEAARDGHFSVYTVSSVDEAIELLSGIQAGAKDEQGMFEEETFNSKVQTRLIELATIRHAFAEATRVQVKDHTQPQEGDHD